MIWYEMEYNKPDQGFVDRLYSEPETFDYDEVKEVIDELNKTNLSLQCCNRRIL